jgi:hypothetical protein
MIDEPNATPVIMPEALPAVATDVLLLLQVPPATGSLNAIVAPMHTADGPVMAVGGGLMVTVVVVKQPVLSL